MSFVVRTESSSANLDKIDQQRDLNRAIETQPV